MVDHDGGVQHFLAGLCSCCLCYRFLALFLVSAEEIFFAADVEVQDGLLWRTLQGL